MKIQTERLTLMTIDKKMFKKLIKKKRYKNICSQQWPIDIVKAIVLADLKRFRNKSDYMKWSVWAIVLNESQTIIGDAGFKGLPDINGQVDLGYSILPQYRRQGYCYEATAALVSFALSQERVAFVTADCLKDNAASIMTLKKLGFEITSEDDDYFYWKKH